MGVVLVARSAGFSLVLVVRSAVARVAVIRLRRGMGRFGRQCGRWDGAGQSDAHACRGGAWVSGCPRGRTGWPGHPA
nr:hypothetical protein [Kibdelosporangium sp. MJ126-NF4]CTQ88300.1 hypothetical protein [Kibdelosporangium sp. MJ126-NF4]